MNIYTEKAEKVNDKRGHTWYKIWKAGFDADGQPYLEHHLGASPAHVTHENYSPEAAKLGEIRRLQRMILRAEDKIRTINKLKPAYGELHPNRIK